jgi:ATP-dependent DNA helicase RecG
MMDVNLSEIRGIGKTRLQALKADGIETVRQLLLRLPAEYRDLTHVTPIDALREGEAAAVAGRIETPRSFRKGRLAITSALVTDVSGAIRAVWYNQPWLAKSLSDGREVLLYGRVERKGGLQLTSPSIEKERGIVPVYRKTCGIPGAVFRDIVTQALKEMEGQWPDELPEALRRRHALCERNFAMRAAHLPESMEALEVAKRRLAFEELLIYQVGLWLLRGRRGAGAKIPCPQEDVEAFWASLPYRPTEAQARVLNEIAIDMEGEAAMARLVQGDVGCGKTAIAMGALYLAAKRGFQGALMAPTEVLARQHYESAKQVLEPLGVPCGLLTGSMTAKEHREAHEAIASGAWRVAIGTHALISEKVLYENLGLVVTDEQHRFGVRQRTALSAKGQSANVLVMSATPIPRTLSLILYGDLDISIVDQLPPGRTPVKTRVVPDEKRLALYGFLKKEAAEGRQVYVVCPLVEESEAIDAQNAQSVYEDLRDNALKGLRVGLVHGKMKSGVKEAALESFRRGELDVLVSTTVIEVGVNVPNASVMVVENADRFGLAQLHQLRGRVGRGAQESWCFLMAESNEKLKLMTATNDGFEIARKDLENRGPGDVLGYRQSGGASFSLWQMADGRLLKESHDEARSLLKRPDSEESKQVIALAQESLAEQLREIAMN